MLPRDHEIVHSMEKIDELFSVSDIIIIAVESDSLFSNTTLQKLSIFQDSLESIDMIGKVTSIFTQNTFYQMMVVLRLNLCWFTSLLILLAKVN